MCACLHVFGYMCVHWVKRGEASSIKTQHLLLELCTVADVWCIVYWWLSAMRSPLLSGHSKKDTLTRYWKMELELQGHMETCETIRLPAFLNLLHWLKMTGRCDCQHRFRLQSFWTQIPTEDYNKFWSIVLLIGKVSIHTSCHFWCCV